MTKKIPEKDLYKILRKLDSTTPPAIFERDSKNQGKRARKVVSQRSNPVYPSYFNPPLHSNLRSFSDLSGQYLANSRSPHLQYLPGQPLYFIQGIKLDGTSNDSFNQIKNRPTQKTQSLLQTRSRVKIQKHGTMSSDHEDLSKQPVGILRCYSLELEEPIAEIRLLSSLVSNQGENCFISDQKTLMRSNSVGSEADVSSRNCLSKKSSRKSNSLTYLERNAAKLKGKPASSSPLDDKQSNNEIEPLRNNGSQGSISVSVTDRLFRVKSSRKVNHDEASNKSTALSTVDMAISDLVGTIERIKQEQIRRHSEYRRRSKS